MLASRQLARSFGIVSQRRAGGAARLFAAKADAPDPLEVRGIFSHFQRDENAKR